MTVSHQVLLSLALLVPPPPGPGGWKERGLTDYQRLHHALAAKTLRAGLAAREGRVEICKLLLAHKAAPVDTEGWCGYPVLYHAIPHPAVVKLLLQAGAPADRQITWMGFRSGFHLIGTTATLLHFAAQWGPVESARLLLGKGAKVNARDDEGHTPLHIAAWCRRADMVRLLLEWGADRSAKDRAGKTPLDLAGGKGAPAAVTALLRPSNGHTSVISAPSQLGRGCFR